MKKYRVLEIASMNNRAGIENFIMNVLRNIDHDKCQIDFLYTTNLIGPYDDEILSYGCNIYRIEPTGRSITMIKKHNDSLKKLLLDINPDVVHIHGNTAIGCLDSIVAKRLKINKIIVHSHNSSCGGLRSKILHYLFKPLINFSATDKLGCSIAACEWMFYRNNFKVVNNGIDTSKYKYCKKTDSSIREKYNLFDYKIIGHVGRFTLQKNHGFIIDTFKIVHERDKNTKLMLIGSGETKIEVIKKIEMLNLSDSVLILDEVYNINEIMQSFDLFVLPSKWEGLGIVLIEAQAVGIPCIVSESIVEEAKITDLVHTVSLKKGPKEWADKVLNLITSDKKDYREELIDSGYDIRITSNFLENVYSGETKDE
jgi:glycosyltransferase involved in cell wall biosynthesis